MAADGHAPHAPTPRAWVAPLLDIIAGTLGGAAGKLIEFPFDTVKVRLQAAGIGAHERYDGTADCVRRLYRAEGARGFFRGMSLPLLGTVAETSCLFTANGALKRQLREMGHIAPDAELPLRYVLLAGGGTGFLVSWVLTPIELVKCRLQVAAAAVAASAAAAAPPATVYAGPLDCLTQSVRGEGLRVLYRGHVGTLLREVPGTACWFGAYESFLRAMTPPGAARGDLHPATIVAAGALGGMSYWAIMFPCDTVKSAMQITQAGAAVGAGAPAAAPSAPQPAAAPRPAPAASAAGGASSGSVFSGLAHAAAAPAGGDASAVAAQATVRAVRARLPAGVAAATGGGGGAGGAALAAAPAAAFSTAAGPPPLPPGGAAPTISRSFFASFASVYRTRGVRGLYAGLAPTLVRAAPSNAAIFLVYEWSVKHLQAAAGV